MATLVIPNTFIPGTKAEAAKVTGNFNSIVNWSTTLDVDNFATLTGELDFNVGTTKAVEITNTGTQPSIDVLSNGSSTALAIANSVQLTGSKSTILITDSVAQVTAGSAELKMALSASATIPAVEILHGANVTFQVKKTHLVVPSKTTAERDAIVAAPVASVLFNSTVQELQFNTSSGWAQSVPTGSVQTFAGFIVPTGWLLCDGTAVNRTTYAALLAVLSKSSTGDTHTSTLIDNIPAGGTTNVVAGWYISGPGIQAGTTVTVVGATSLTLSLATTASTNGVAFTAAPYGIGNGTTTFNVPDCRGVFIRGAGAQTISAKVFTGVLGVKAVDTTAVNGLTDSGHGHAISATSSSYRVLVSLPNFGANNHETTHDEDPHRPVRAYGASETLPAQANSTSANLTSPATETTPGNISLNYIIKT